MNEIASKISNNSDLKRFRRIIDDINISPLRGSEASDNLFFCNNSSPSGFSDFTTPQNTKEPTSSCQLRICQEGVTPKSAGMNCVI